MKKTARECFEALLDGAATLQPTIERPPEMPDNVPAAERNRLYLEFAVMNCAMWGSTVHGIEVGEFTVTLEKRSEAMRMLALACKCYLAALKEMRS